MVQLKTILDLSLQNCITLRIKLFGGYLLKCIHLYDVSMFQKYEF